MTKPKNKKKEHEKNKIQMFRCINCMENKKKSEFYNSASVFHAGTGKTPYCKDCLRNMALDENKRLDNERLKKILHEADKPYLYYVLQSSYDEARKNKENLKTDKEVVGKYFKNINSLTQYKNLTWDDSEFEPEEYEYDKGENENELDETNEENDKSNVLDENFEVSREMIVKWGKDFDPEHYMMLEDLYDNLSKSHDIEDRSQEEYLKTACLYQLRNIEAVRKGNAAEAQKWGSLFDNYMASGKLKPNQLSESDRMGGVTNFATFFQFVEKSESFTPTFPDLIIDDIDYAIYKFINYNRDLMGMPLIELGEVKDFMTYDYEKGQEIIFPDKKDIEKAKQDNENDNYKNNQNLNEDVLECDSDEDGE